MDTRGFGENGETEKETGVPGHGTQHLNLVTSKHLRLQTQLYPLSCCFTQERRIRWGTDWDVTLYRLAPKVHSPNLLRENVY